MKIYFEFAVYSRRHVEYALSFDHKLQVIILTIFLPSWFSLVCIPWAAHDLDNTMYSMKYIFSYQNCVCIEYSFETVGYWDITD